MATVSPKTDNSERAEEASRKFRDILKSLGVDSRTIELMLAMSPYKVQVFLHIYNGYRNHPDVIRKKAGEDLERYRKIFRDRGHILTPDEENRFLESLPDLLLPKILFRLFFASELKEFSSNILVSASDRTAFLTAQDRKPEIIIRPVQMED
jgi:hypothetical protein